MSETAYAQAPAASVNVKDLGARGDGSADDAPAIQKALDQGGTIVIPPGRYIIGRTLLVGSRTRIIAHPQALIMLADGVGKVWNDFLLANRDPEAGNHDIEITGGTWSGNNINNPRGEKLVDPGKYGGVMINFRNVSKLSISDCMLCDAQSYYLRLTRVSNFIVEHIRFHAQHPCNNNDGVHLAGHCHHGIIRHLRGLGRCTPNDDMVAMNADDALDRVECFGGECGPITNIHVSDIVADQCHTFVRMLSVVSPIENIDIDHIRGGCDIAVLNMDGARGCRVPVFDEKDPRFARGVGQVRNVRVSDVIVHKASATGTALINAQQIADELEIRSFTRDIERDASPDAPTLLARYMPEQLLELEGVTHQQADEMRQASSAEIQVRLLYPGDPTGRLAVRSHIQWGQEARLPRGGFTRLRLAAGR